MRTWKSFALITVPAILLGSPIFAQNPPEPPAMPALSIDGFDDYGIPEIPVSPSVAGEDSIFTREVSTPEIPTESETPRVPSRSTLIVPGIDPEEQTESPLHDRNPLLSEGIPDRSATFEMPGYNPESAGRQPLETVSLPENRTPPPPVNLSPAPQDAFERLSSNGNQTISNLNLLRSLEETDHPFYGLLKAEFTRDSKINGIETPLSEVLANVASPAIRTSLVQGYWELEGALVEFRHRTTQERELLSFGSQNPQIQAATKLITQKKRIAELNFIRKQNEFASLLQQNGVVLNGNSPNSISNLPKASAEMLPIPCDYPLIRAYETKAEELERALGRVLSRKAALLDKTIPIAHEMIDNSQEAIDAAQEYYNTVRGSQISAELLVFALEQLTESRISHSNSIIDYNLMIAEYVGETVGPEVAGRKLLTTLLVLPKEENVNARNNVPVQAPIREASLSNVRTPEIRTASGYDAKAINEPAPINMVSGTIPAEHLGEKAFPERNPISNPLRSRGTPAETTVPPQEYPSPPVNAPRINF